MWKRIVNIWKKELMDSLRDKKALRSALLVPVIIGIIYAVMTPILSSTFEKKIEKEAQESVVVLAQGIENVNDGLELVFDELDIELELYEGDLAAFIQEGEASIGLIVPPSFGDEVENGVSAEITLLINPSGGESSIAGDPSSRRLNQALQLYAQNLTAERLTAAGVDISVLEPLNIQREMLITSEQQGGLQSSFMLPILVAIVTVTGAMFIAIDITAGEKERGTLEALLQTPTTDLEIYVGKLLSVFTFSIVPLALTFTAFGLATNFLPESMGGGATLPVFVIISSVVAGLPLSLVISVVLMMIAIRTKTFKDAQSAISPVMMLVMFPAMAAAFFPPSNSLLYAVPAYGTAAVIGGAATNGAMNITHFLISAAGCLLLSAVGIAIGLRLFDRERLLYSM